MFQRFFSDLCLIRMFVSILKFNDYKQLFKESGHTLQNVDVRNGMEGFDPLDQHHLAVLVFGRAKLVTDSIDQLVKIEHQALVERSIDNVFHEIIDLFGVFLDVIGESGTNKPYNTVEDIQKVFISENSFFTRFDNVEHSITCCQLYLLILVIETLNNRGQKLIQKLNLPLLVQCDGNDRKSI